MSNTRVYTQFLAETDVFHPKSGREKKQNKLDSLFLVAEQFWNKRNYKVVKWKE